MSGYHDEDLIAARTLLSRARADAREAARVLFADATADAQRAVDEAVLTAYQKGATKTAIAALMGESRTTINERLARVTGGRVKEQVPTVVQTQPEHLTYLIDGDKLHVDWRNYGPDHITDFGVVEIVYDTDEGSYWFMADGEDMNQVTQRLDTQFTGWYYHDAEQFVKSMLQNEVEET